MYFVSWMLIGQNRVPVALKYPKFEQQLFTFVCMSETRSSSSAMLIKIMFKILFTFCEWKKKAQHFQYSLRLYCIWV